MLTRCKLVSCNSTIHIKLLRQEKCGSLGGRKISNYPQTEGNVQHWKMNFLKKSLGFPPTTIKLYYMWKKLMVNKKSQNCVNNLCIGIPQLLHLSIGIQTHLGQHLKVNNVHKAIWTKLQAKIKA